VSAFGADPRSLIFYNRIKGEMEKGLGALRYRSLTIARPSILVGKRERQRTGERIAAGISFLTPPRIRPINASDVAAALVHQAWLDEPGTRVLESPELRSIAAATRSTPSAPQPVAPSATTPRTSVA